MTGRDRLRGGLLLLALQTGVARVEELLGSHSRAETCGGARDAQPQESRRCRRVRRILLPPRARHAYNCWVSRRYHSVTTQLVIQSQDASLSGVQVFNNPLIRFKSETFIVMMISWTYLLHADYCTKGGEYRYYSRRGRRRRFERAPGGAFKYCDLRKCLSAVECPLDNETRKNTLFLVGLCDAITHHMSPVLDEFVSARYHACCLNFNRYIKELPLRYRPAPWDAAFISSGCPVTLYAGRG